jgi:hypothetical protein
MRSVLAVLSLLLAGCATLRPDAGEALRVREIVDAAVTAARAAPAEQARRVTLAQRAFSAAPDDANRLGLAVLLATLAPPQRDEARAAVLLKPLATRQPETPFTQFARLLAVHVAESQKLALDLRAAELRARAAELRVQEAELRVQEAELRVAAAERREQAATERADTLNRQVEALKSIERGILEREGRRRPNRR